MKELSENMEYIPIIFVHRGNHFYLKNALRQAALLNPRSEIYLLGDESNRKIKGENIHHFFLKDYRSSADEFAGRYRHLSSNNEAYELFCFQRWFIIREFAVKQGLTCFLYLDSDVLLYCNITEELQDKLTYDFTVCDYRVPNVTLMKVENIIRFTDYITSLYTEEHNLKLLEELYRTCFDAEGKRIKMGGVSDMTAMEFYQKYVSDRVIDLAIPHDGVCFDGNIGISSGFKMKDGLKEVIWIDDIPYGKYGAAEELIRWGALHFQGRAKMKQQHYLLDQEKRHIRHLSFAMRWVVTKAWISKIWSGVRKLPVILPHLITVYKVKGKL